MFSFSRRTKLFLGVAAVVGAGFAGAALWPSRNAVPKEFAEARVQGAIISQAIVDLSNQSASNLQQINQLDDAKNFSQATDIALKTIQDSREIRSRAVELSDQVSKMTQSLSGISSFEARQAAFDAIASRLALISRLINYSDYLNQLLQNLQARFDGHPGKYPTATIIDQINAEVTAINNFNTQATRSMDRFDQITKGQ